MSTSRFHKVISISFALLYSVVGLMGESLHYFRADSPIQWNGSQRVEVAGYYHLHANDLQAHFHPYVRYSRETGFELVRVVPKSNRGPRERAFSDFDQYHAHHTSPLLGLIGKLKLSQVVGQVSPTAVAERVVPIYESVSLRTFEVAVQIAPRGPPANLA